MMAAGQDARRVRVRAVEALWAVAVAAVVFGPLPAVAWADDAASAVVAEPPSGAPSTDTPDEPAVEGAPSTSEPSTGEPPAATEASSIGAEPATTEPVTTEPAATGTMPSGIGILADGEVSLTKTASRTVVRPGEELEYRLTASCSSLTTNCVDFRIVDVLPADLEITSLPPSNSQREVSFDAGTRTLTVLYKLPLPSTAQTGLPAGGVQSLAIGMRLPLETAVVNGATITNSATASSIGFVDRVASIDVTAEIPVRLDPVATKTWAPPMSIAQSDAVSQITLGVRTASSSSAEVTELTVADTTTATFERFDLTSAGTLLAVPDGADRVTVEVCTRPLGSPCVLPGDWVTSAPQAAPTLPTVLSAPGGVNLADVTGIRYRFTNSLGTTLPYDPTPGQVRFDVRLRDTLRSTGAPLLPTVTERVNNCASPSLIATSGAATGADACARFAIEPDTVVVGGTKTIYSDPTGSFTPGGVVVVGYDSPVSMKITAQNNSAFPVSLMRIVEPSPSTTSDWDKLTVLRGRFTFPAGATGATLKVTCRSGTNPADVSFTRPPSPTTVALSTLGCAPGVGAATVQIDFTGAASGTLEPLLTTGASGSIELHGLGDGATMADVSDGGLRNCANVLIASQVDGTGSAAATTCAITAVEAPRPGVGSASKSTSGVYTITPGQDLAFRLSFRNRGNVPVTNVVVVDPPNPAAADNPFGKVRLTGLRAANSDPASRLEVYDPTVSAYVPYVASDAALLARATGIRVTVTGNLVVNQTFSVDYTVRLRDGMPVGTSFRNCAAIGIENPAIAAPFCLPSTVTNGVPGSGANLNKVVVPSPVFRPQPGLPAQVVTVKHRAQNTGTLYLKRLVVTDTDADFFDAAVFRGSIAVNFPVGANRVRVDVCTSAVNCAAGVWVTGTRTSSSSPSIPGGVALDAVKGIRFTFENSSNGYEILPAPNFPPSGACPDATVCFRAEVRQFLDSAPSTPVPDRLANTSSGAGESELQTPGTTFAIPDVTATVDVVPGTARLALDKGPDSRIGPGDSAPVSLVLTNTGTDAVVEPRVVDPLPALLTFDPVVAGAPAGQPYLIDYVLPAGYAPPPTVAYAPVLGGPGVAGCADVGRVCSVAWSFPGWNLPPGGKIRVQFNVTLTPGVTAGQVITNTAGATGSNSGLECSGASVIGDPSFGPGRYCTDPAAVTVLAGDDFLAQKWVAADPGLGFLDATGAVVPITSSECPRYTSGATVYTRFPCTARVLPGGTIDYLIRGVNSGTNPASQVVLVDGLAVAGDTGVLLTGQSRGTQWSTRPTMVSPVVNLEGYAGVTTGYTTAGFPGGSFCTTDLAPPPSTCPAGSFGAGLSSAVTGFRTTLSFPDADLLLPGESFTLAWKMRAPATLASPLAEPIAWNSFAYRPSFRVGTATVTLPATEPVKVGVGMPLGSFAVTKQVEGLPAGVSLEPFPFVYECTVTTDEGDEVVAGAGFQLGDDGVFTGPQLPKGAVCRIWETDARGGESTNLGEDEAAVITIDATPGPQEVTVVNTFDSGSLRVEKTVEWGAGVTPVAIADPFEVTVDCGFPTLGDRLVDFPRTVEVIDGGAIDIVDLPVGTECTVVENERRGATITTMQASNADLVEADAVGVAVEPTAVGGTVVDLRNVYETGGIELTKVLDGGASLWAQGPFVFQIDCTAPGFPALQEIVELEPERLSTTIAPIPAGAQCTVVETETGGAGGSVVTPSTFSIPTYPLGGQPPGPVQVTSTNLYPAGYVSVAKVLAGSAASVMAAAEFEVRVQCERTLIEGDGVQVFLDSTVKVRGGVTTLLPEAVPIGARCWAIETDSVGAGAVSVSHPVGSPAVVSATSPDITITVTNTFEAGGTNDPGGDPAATGIRITKQLTGGGAAWARGPFVFTTTCTLGGYTLPAYTTTLDVGRLVGHVNPVPVGARCQVVETDNGSAPAAVPFVVGTVTVPAASSPPVEVVAVNDFPGAVLEVTKRTVGGGASATFGFLATCTSAPDSGPAFVVDLSGSATDGVTAMRFTLTSGATRSISVPAGAVCRVEETDRGGATSTTYQVSNGQQPTSITVQGTVRVTVTNAFGVMPTTGASTTMLLMQWALGLLGAGLALRRLARRQPMPYGKLATRPR